jgi:Patatin-like phospholipase
MTLSERIERPGPKKLLAIDGGGIRGVLALEVLQTIEDLLKAQSQNPDFRLAHYFDYIAGTSTGGIIAAGLSVGMSVGKLLEFYDTAGPQLFVKANLLRRLRYKFDDEPLADQLRQVFGKDTTLGSEKVQTLLLLVMRNATTDSPWPISNNPHAKYNATTRGDCNLKFPLWKLVRASTAAPTYFPPEVFVLPIQGKDREFIFVDGGVTMYNNPAFQMFLMATLDRYWFSKPAVRWQAGREKMLIVSIGTGTSPGVKEGLQAEDMNLLFNATTIPSALMFAALNEQDLLCRVFGDCRAGDLLDREIGDVCGSSGPLGLEQKLFTYMRYNAELTRDGLDTLGCKSIEPETVQRLDAVDGIPQLRAVGRAVAKEKVREAHFAGFRPG